MKLVAYEFKKLNVRKFILPAFIILSCINMFLYAQKSARIGEIARDPNVNALFKTYISNRETFEAGYAMRKEEMALAVKVVEEARTGGSRDYYFPEPAYIPDVPYIDKYEIVIARAEYSNFYRNFVSGIINGSRRNLQDFEETSIGIEDYAYKLQQHIIKKYTNIRETAVIGFENVRGWDLLLDSSGDIFIFILVAFVVGTIFTVESTTGFQPTLHITKKGRSSVCAAKITAAFLTVVIAVIVIYLPVIIIVGYNTGFSNIGNGIQNIQAYAGCEYNISMGQAVMITFAIKTAVLFVFALFTAAAALIFRSYPFSFAISVLLFAVNYIIYYFTQTASAAHHLNMANAARVSGLFERYRALNLFSEPISFISIILFFTVLFLIVFPPVILYLHSSHTIALTVAKSINKISILKTNRTKENKIIRQKTYSKNLMYYELYKSFFNFRVMLIIILCVSIKVYYDYRIYSPKTSPEDRYYKNYMSKISGVQTDEKRAYITEENEFISKTIAQAKKISTDFAEDRISRTDYSAFLHDYNYSLARQEAARKMLNQSNYLDSLKQNSGISASYIYETGWQKLLFAGADYFLTGVLIFIFCGIFSAEYADNGGISGFASILRSTKKGRNEIFKTKILGTMAVAVIFCMVFTIFDVWLINKYIGLSMPLASIASFPEIGIQCGGINIIGFILLGLFFKYMGFCILSLVIVALSELLKNRTAVTFICVIIFVLPEFIHANLSVFSHNIILPSITAGANIILKETITKEYVVCFGEAVMLTAIYAVLSVILVYIAKKNYCK